MSLEHRVRETIDSATGRVRRDVETHLRALVSDVSRLLQDSQENWRTEVERAASDARIDTERALRARMDTMRQDHSRDLETRVSSERAELEAAMAAVKAEMREDHVDTFSRLLTAVRRLDDVTSLSGILDTLARGTSLEASRVAVFVVDGETLRSWGHYGFPPGHAPADLPIATGGIVGTAVQHKQIAFVSPTADPKGSLDPARGGPETPQFMQVPAGHIGMLIPIVVGGEVVVLLYANGVERRADHETAVTWTEQVELLVRHAALRLENVTSIRTVEVLTKTV
jgi:hypothetical protein